MNTENEAKIIEKVFVDVLRKLLNDESIADIQDVLKILEKFNAEGQSHLVVKVWDVVNQHPLWLAHDERG